MEVNSQFSVLLKALKATDDPVVLYGAGTYGKQTYEFFCSVGLEDRVIGFCDTNKARISTQYCGKPVLAIDSFCSLPRCILLLSLDPLYHSAVIQRLQHAGVPANSIHAVAIPQIDIREIPLPAAEFRVAQDNVSLQRRVFSHLCDETSRRIFVSQLCGSLTHPEKSESYHALLNKGIRLLQDGHDGLQLADIAGALQMQGVKK